MTGVLQRSLAILEVLSRDAGGLSVTALAARLDAPASAVHRLLGELVRFGYVRQDKAQGDYRLTIKLAALGLNFLGQTGVSDIAQPVIDRLARSTGELIRLSILDDRTLVWVAMAQGATSGLRYDPAIEQGLDIHFASTAGGQAFLSALTDEEALMLVSTQGFVPKYQRPGPNAPRTVTELLTRLAETRRRGYAVAIDSYMMGMAAMAVPVRDQTGTMVIGALSIAGPAARLTEERFADFAAELIAAAEELGRASFASGFLGRSSRLQGSVLAEPATT
jgi:IclR family transcriptional regulator, acetate operon repressor